MSKRRINWKKQIVDQTAHFVIGGMATFCFIWGLQWHWLLAIFGVMSMAGLREVLQHDDLKFGWGSAIDMAFWLAGCIVVAILWRMN